MVIDKQLFFHLFLLIFMLLFLVLGNSFLIYFLILAFLLVGWSFKSMLNWSKISKYRVWFWLGASTVAALLVSSLTTHSIPLSLEAIMVHIFYLVVFFYVLLLKDGFLKQSWVAAGLVLIGFLLGLLSLVFNVLPGLAALLPGMNLLHATYGHNHLAAFLILIFPLSWQLESLVSHDFLPKSSRWRSLFKFAPLMIAGLVVLSFGRVALTVIFLQAVVALALFRQNLLREKNEYQVWKAVVILASLSLVVLAFISSLTLFWPNFSCSQIGFLESKICKQIKTEARPYYWAQAVETVTQYPWFGFGPGTFALASRRFSTHPDFTSAHAHNDWLELAAESGLVGFSLGTLFLGGLMVLVTKLVFSTQANAPNSLTKAIWLGIAGLLVNSLFDFDFQFRGIFICLLLFIALIIREQGNRRAVSIEVKTEKCLYVVYCLFLIIVTLGYSVVDATIVSGKTAAAFTFFPYYLPHMKIFAFSEDLSSTQRAQLVRIYSNHPDFYPAVLSNNKANFSISDQAFIYQKMIEANPWQRRTVSPLIYLMADNQWEAAVKEASAFPSFFARAESTLGYPIDYQWRQQVAREILLVANHFYQAGDYTKLAELIKLAVKINEWSWSDFQVSFAQADMSSKDQSAYLAAMLEIPTDYFGPYGYTYAQLYLAQVVSQPWDQNSPLFIAKMASLDEYMPSQLWRAVTSSYQQQSQLLSSPTQQAEGLEKWYGTWLVVKNMPNVPSSTEARFLAQALSEYSTRPELSAAEQNKWEQRADEVSSWYQ